MSEETNDTNRTSETRSTADPSAPTATDEQLAKPATAAAEAAPVERNAPPPKSAAGVGTAVGVVAVLALLAGGAYVTRDHWLPLVGPMVGIDAQETGTATSAAGQMASAQDAAAASDALAAQLVGLSDRLATMEASVTQLTQSVDKLSSDSASTKDLAAAVNVLAERVTRIERTSADISQLQREFGDLSKRAVALRDGFSGLNATILATNQLAQAVDNGLPYTRPLAAVRSVAGDDREIAAVLVLLEPYAATGIPTFAALHAQFPAVADAVARAAPTTGGEEWYNRALDKVLSLVTVRVTGDTAAHAGGVDAILAEAETALAGGDLGAAVSLLDRLDGTAAAPAADWLRAAHLRLTAMQALSRLQEQAALRLAQARG